jgi:hypothetical protein
MTRDHFSKQMSNPYFQTKHYREESAAAQIEINLENKIKSFFKKFRMLRLKRK